MLRICPYCHRVHDTGAKCEEQRKAERARWNRHRDGKADRFRSSKAWSMMSLRVRQRDGWRCVFCQREQDDLRDIIDNQISVHHITPIQEDYNKRLDINNLITVCSYHHELCERGAITRNEQREIAKEMINKEGNN